MAESEELSWCAERLRCERLPDGALVGTPRPRLSWGLPETGRADLPVAAQVRVALDAAAPGRAADLWDSGWTEGESASRVYGGPALASRQRLTWTVRLRTASGASTGWAAPSSFEVGLLSRSDWRASWIGLPPRVGTGRGAYYVRKRFVLDELPTRAVAYVSALGVYRAAVNGASIGDALLRPGWTDQRRRVVYDRLDLTPHLVAGDNVFAGELAPGWYAGRIATHVSPDSMTAVPAPELLAQLELVFADGSRRILASDESWEWSPSPVLSSDLYDGEDWDLRLGDTDWAGHRSAGRWEQVERTNGTAGELVAPRAAPVRVLARVPAAVEFREDGAVIVDSGSNDSGYLEVSVDEAPGRRVEILYGEILDRSGNLYRENLRSARCADSFVCAGSPGERLAPAFTFRGFRYAEIRGLSAPDRLRSAEAVTLGTDLERTGWFSSGAGLLEDVYELMVCSMRSNYLEVPTDCPQRDERMGWLADALLFAPVAAYTYDIAAFMAKWFDDILDARTPEGAFPDIAPRPSARWPEQSADPGAPAWGDAGILLPWLMYERYGDEDVLERMYPAMLEHLDLVHGRNPEGIWRRGRGKDYGDWVPAGPDTSHDLFATGWLYRSTSVASQVARVLGHREDAERLASLADRVRRAFRERYVDDATGRIADPEPTSSPAASYFAPILQEETQTGYIVSLALGLLDDRLAERSGARLADLVRATGGRLQTGFCGSAFLPAALDRAGYAGLAYDLLLREEPPSLGFMAKMGATSVWERWDGLDVERRPASPTMNSFNHYAMSSMLAWLVEGVCGLRPVPGVAAHREVVFAPSVSRRVPSASFRLEAPSGRVEVGWQWQGDDRVVGHLRLPAGMRATLARTVAVDDARAAARRAPLPGDDGDGVPAVVGAGEHELVWTVV